MTLTARALRAVAITCTVLGMLTLLLSGGAFDGVGQTIAGRYCEMLPELLAPVPVTPNTTRAQLQLETCGRRVADGSATLVEVAEYTAELAGAAEDERIDDAEVLVLDRIYDDMSQH